MIPLFQQFPILQKNIPYISLCDLPTPVIHMKKLGEKLKTDHIYIKQDGLTSKRYGGNKIRKLEFLLGEAKQKGYKKVITYGFTGSNHATATAIHANSLGLRSISMLASQENAEYVRINLLLSLCSGAEIHHYSNRKKREWGNRFQKIKHLVLDRHPVYVIPSGGSSPTGITGFVNAAFELKSQIEQNLIPEPDVIYVAMGSAGTAVGLLIGIKLLGLKTKLIPVRVIENDFTSEERIRSEFKDTICFLHQNTPEIPQLEFNTADFPVNDRFLGAGYARFTKEGTEAIRLLKETEDVKLDGTYTGKAMAALLADSASGQHKNKVVLFWNTLNAYDLSNKLKDLNYKDLPEKLHPFFETNVQELDN